MEPIKRSFFCPFSCINDKTGNLDNNFARFRETNWENEDEDPAEMRPLLAANAIDILKSKIEVYEKKTLSGDNQEEKSVIFVSA